MYRFYRKDPVMPLRNRIIRRLIRGINLTTVLLITFIVQVSANSFAQKISLSARNKPIVEVIKEIRSQTGLDFMFTNSAISNARPVTITVKNVELSEVLKQISATQPLDFTFQDKSVVISLRNENPRSAILNKDIIVSGKVVDERGQGLPGATIKLKGSESKIAITTSADGNFSVNVPGENAVLVVSYIGYQTKEVTVAGADVNLVIKMEEVSGELKGVTVVSTGYQDLPKERATGSFEKIDNALLNRSTGVNILSRLENVTPGLLIDRRSNRTGTPGTGQVTIRGLSTMTQSIAVPLVILDNFPYEGDINNINPNDVESVTILKDAAAASIWGARAANGVIVITTKKGQYNKAANIAFSTNVNITEKPDLMALKTLNSSEFIDLEKELFNLGFYNNKINDVYTWPYLSPVVELMLKARSPGATISQAEANRQIDAYRNQDIRKDYLKYIYRPAVAQQYALNINGGGNDFSYQLSGGYDQYTSNQIKEGGNRVTLRTAFTYKPIKNLEFDFSTLYTQTKNQGLSAYSPIAYSSGNTLPYMRLVDDAGNPAIVGRSIGDRFLNKADARYLDWRYRPLTEPDASSRSENSYNLLMNFGSQYQFSKIFSASVKYQYTHVSGESKDLNGPDSYYTRNYINSLTSFSGNSVTRNLPVGGILQQNFNNGSSYSIRGQINADKNWGQDHQLNVLAGVEQNEKINRTSRSTQYGYDDNTLTHAEVDQIRRFITPLYSFLSMPSGIAMTDRRNRFQSYFVNAAYTYKQRYTVSASGRKDAANLYGVATNLRGAPFWSAGLSWNLSRESFYHSDFLSDLKIRATYGYQGNTDSNLAAFSTIGYNTLNDFAVNLPYANILNPANDALRWERVGTLNLGLDFSLKGGYILGSIEYYNRSANDVLSLAPIDYTSGFSFATVNNASLKTKGIDLSLQAKIISRKAFQWNTDLFFNYNNNKVTKFTPLNENIDNYLSNGLSIPSNFIVGKPILSLYAYSWAGLDPQTGDPMGFLNGEKSENYTALTSIPASQLVYQGSAVPIYSTGFRNTFRYKNFTISANITGKFGYVFRRKSADYNSLSNSQSSSTPNADFALRWKKPGDEQYTNVPSLVYPFNVLRSQFYTFSSALISKADNIRLQDVNISYQIGKPDWTLKNIRIFAIASNLGILWKADKSGLDPDYYTSYPPQKTFSLGLNANF